MAISSAPQAIRVKIYNLRKVQYTAGHPYVSSTEDYKQQVLDELQSDAKKFHPLG